MCLYPKLIPNPKYKANQKNNGIVPECKDLRLKVVAIGCSNCMECTKQKASSWKSRLSYELTKGIPKWVCLTFSNESIRVITAKGKAKIRENKISVVKPISELQGYERDNAIAKQGVRWFLERWRKKFGVSLKHWFVTELGHNGTENIHLHGFVWTNEEYKMVEEIWKWGYIYPYRKDQKVWVNNKTINYMVKYMSKKDLKHKYYKPMILTSPGIGSGWEKTSRATLSKYKGKDTTEYTRANDGKILSLPIYWRNKLYTEEEREQLWLMRMDKDIRYIDGVEIENASKNVAYLLEVLKQKQMVNREYGYRNITDWRERKYEEDVRNLLHWKRLHNVK